MERDDTAFPCSIILEEISVYKRAWGKNLQLHLTAEQNTSQLFVFITFLYITTKYLNQRTLRKEEVFFLAHTLRIQCIFVGKPLWGCKGLKQLIILSIVRNQMVAYALALALLFQMRLQPIKRYSPHYISGLCTSIKITQIIPHRYTELPFRDFTCHQATVGIKHHIILNISLRKSVKKLQET